MKRVVSFSLWGSEPKYTHGALANADLVNQHYPGAESWFYVHSQSVPAQIIDALRSKPNARVIERVCDLSTSAPATWRFEAMTEPEVSICLFRDTDSRITNREVAAVNEWLKAGTAVHLMRDHYVHHRLPVLAGMFGVRDVNGFSKPDWSKLLAKHSKYSTQWGHDLPFVNEFISRVPPDQVTLHSTDCDLPSDGFKGRPFPTPYDASFDFVGSYVYPDGSRHEPHHDHLKRRYGSR